MTEPGVKLFSQQPAEQKQDPLRKPARRDSKRSAYRGPETVISKQEIEEILTDYGVGEISSIEDISTMFCPNRIVLAFKPDGDLVNLKGLPNQEGDIVGYETDIIALLNQEGVGVQQLITTKTGDYSVEKDGTLYLAYRKLEGDQIKDIDQEVCREFGVHMARLHKVLQKYAGHEPVPRVDETFRHADDTPEQVGSFPLRTEYERLFAEFGSQINTEQLERQVIHGGVSTTHSFFVGKKFNAFIDWDYAHVGYRAYDVALFMADMLVSKPELFADYLNAYTQENPLNDQEKKSLYYFIKYRLLFNIKKYNFYARTDSEQVKGRSVAQEMIKAYTLMDGMGLDGFLALTNRDTRPDVALIVTDADLERTGFKGVLHSRAE
ncbi:MAG: hypothetical protein A3A33_02430 [Candidatus Yanofskybacteria bacterium RIFCSPLOWO2_01_FULL_49_25]|uniref:Aminoglycoside phosphotransferase domain-containing protein n=1 Tax=Candidatus Yanofskybacteria bacterium RIFCSPLOWO2_01_FULL_49_25 TaxID=1802701 RepID=A0A1F8GUS6_9BACT|nr:MAG: hypothetical protein A3A33_02430 [Candidatus Yanofskybacteria bacterium RIFCSPLOWO2_01_FULL_49_25]